jgi:hypothetical protein
MRTLLIMIALLASCLAWPAHAADIPQQLRGAWCRTVVTTDHGATQHIFKRGERCPRGEVVHTYISNGRISKGQGKDVTSCVAETVEKDIGIDDGWTIVFDCGFMRLEQAIWLLPRGRLGMTTMGFGELERYD